MLNIKLELVDKKYVDKYKWTQIYVKATINDVECEYTFTSFNHKPKDVPDTYIFAQVLKYIKYDLENNIL